MSSLLTAFYIKWHHLLQHWLWNAASAGTAAEYTDTLQNFGGPKCYSGYPDAAIAGVGTISAYLVNASLVRADEDDVCPATALELIAWLE